MINFSSRKTSSSNLFNGQENRIKQEWAKSSFFYPFTSLWCLSTSQGKSLWRSGRQPKTIYVGQKASSSRCVILITYEAKQISSINRWEMKPAVVFFFNTSFFRLRFGSFFSQDRGWTTCAYLMCLGEQQVAICKTKLSRVEKTLASFECHRDNYLMRTQ